MPSRGDKARGSPDCAAMTVVTHVQIKAKNLHPGVIGSQWVDQLCTAESVCIRWFCIGS